MSMWTHDTTTHLYNPHRSTISNKVKSVTVLQQIKTALRLSQTKKQGLSDVGNTASFIVSTPIKMHGSDIPGSDFNESDKAGLDNQITRQWQWKLQPHKETGAAWPVRVRPSSQETVHGFLPTGFSKSRRTRNDSKGPICKQKQKYSNLHPLA